MENYSCYFSYLKHRCSFLLAMTKSLLSYIQTSHEKLVGFCACVVWNPDQLPCACVVWNPDQLLLCMLFEIQTSCFCACVVWNPDQMPLCMSCVKSGLAAFVHVWCEIRTSCFCACLVWNVDQLLHSRASDQNLNCEKRFNKNWTRGPKGPEPLTWVNKRAKRPWIAHLSIQAKSQTFNFEIWVTFDQGQRMTLTFDTHSLH